MGQTWPPVIPAQWNKLQNLLSYAADKVPHYRELFRNLGLKPEDIHTPADFRRLPILEKRDIQQQWDDYVSDDYREAEDDNKKWQVNYTSGTTGTPLKIIHSHLEEFIAGRDLMKARISCGLDLPARWAVVGGARYFIAREDNAVDHRFSRGQSEVLFLNLLGVPQSVLHRHIQQLEDFQPSWIYGTPSALATMANLILATRGKSLDLRNLQLIELVAEYASPKTKRLIRKAFHHMPVGMYGCQEIWGMAYECRKGNMHLSSNNSYVEIIKSDGTPSVPGEEGEVIVTGLNFRIMPFIRYRLGDRVVLLSEPCACGNPNSSIKILEGRAADYIAGRPDLVGNLAFDLLMRYMQKKSFATVQQYRVIQSSINHFEVWLACGMEWDGDAKECFVRKARNILGQETTFDFRFMDAIPPHPSGKTRSFIVSDF